MRSSSRRESSREHRWQESSRISRPDHARSGRRTSSAISPRVWPSPGFGRRRSGSNTPTSRIATRQPGPLGLGTGIDLVAAPHHRARRVAREVLEDARDLVGARQLRPRPLARIHDQLGQGLPIRDDVRVGNEAADLGEIVGVHEQRWPRAQDRRLAHAHAHLAIRAAGSAARGRAATYHADIARREAGPRRLEGVTG